MSNYRKQPIPKSIRLEVFRRDNYTCRYCGEKARSPHADHVYPESRGGVTSVDNLVTSCKACNVKKQAKIGMWPLPVGYFDNDKDALPKSYFRKINLVIVIEILFLSFIPYLFWQAVLTQDETIKQLLLIAFIGAGSFGVCAWIMASEIKS